MNVRKYFRTMPFMVIAVLLIVAVIAFSYVELDCHPFEFKSATGFCLDIISVFILLSGSIMLIYHWHKAKKDVTVLLLFLFIISIIAVAMVYFYKCDRVWKLSEQLTYMEVIIGVVSAIVVILGGYVALKQMKESVSTNKIAAQSNKLSSFTNMMDILQEEKARKDRGVVFTLFDEKKNYIRPWKSWSDEEKTAARDTLVKIDQIGLMVKYGLLDYEFLEGWTYSIYKCTYILKDFKDSEEFRYSYKIEGDNELRSNYYLGINELIRRRDPKVIYDYEE